MALESNKTSEVIATALTHSPSISEIDMLFQQSGWRKKRFQSNLHDF